jgi:hypothetical protein
MKLRNKSAEDREWPEIKKIADTMAKFAWVYGVNK